MTIFYWGEPKNNSLEKTQRFIIKCFNSYMIKKIQLFVFTSYISENTVFQH